MSPTSRFWWRWLAITALVLGAVIGLLRLNGSTWHFWPLLLLVVFATSVLALANVGAVSADADWTVHSAQAVSPAGQDTRLAMYTRAVAGHLDAKVPDSALRDRLAGLAERRLRQRRGVGLRDPAAADLLGTDAVAVLLGPTRRLTRDEIDRCVRRIEEV